MTTLAPSFISRLTVAAPMPVYGMQGNCHQCLCTAYEPSVPEPLCMSINGKHSLNVFRRCADVTHGPACHHRSSTLEHGCNNVRVSCTSLSNLRQLCTAL